MWAATPAARQLSSVAADGLIRRTLLKGLGSCSSRAETSPQAEEAPRARAAPPPPVHAPRNNPRDTPIRTQAPKAWPDPKTRGRAPPEPKAPKPAPDPGWVSQFKSQHRVLNK